MRTLQSEFKRHGLCEVETRLATKRREPIKESFSRRDIEELMGVRRSIYKKVKGSFRQK